MTVPQYILTLALCAILAMGIFGREVRYPKKRNMAKAKQVWADRYQKIEEDRQIMKLYRMLKDKRG